MSKPDGTFSDADVVRIFCNHLTKEERNNVILFFVIFSGALVVRSSILDLLGAIPHLRALRLFVRAVLSSFRIFGNTPSDILSNVFSGAMRKAVFACLTKEIAR